MYNITREKAARTIAEYFHTEGTVKYIGGSYSAWACKDNKGREWKITRDSSIQAASDDEKAELGTPILTYEDIPDLQEILRQLRHKGAKSDPAHMCGVHIHIGLNGHTPKSLRNLANIMASHESLLISAMRLDRNRINRYCRTVDPSFLERLNRRKPICGFGFCIGGNETLHRGCVPSNGKPDVRRNNRCIFHIGKCNQ